jgi:signal transduction histidine kinase
MGTLMDDIENARELTDAAWACRIPLAALVGHLAALADLPGTVDPHFHQHMDAVVRSADRLRAAVDELISAAG